MIKKKKKTVKEPEIIVEDECTGCEMCKQDTILPLGEVNFGREDLNKLAAKIDEIIKHLNEHKLR